MKNFKKYVEICSKFHSLKIPKLRFKELDERHRDLYKTLYNSNEADVNKASFVVFLFSLFISITISILFTSLNFLIIILYSVTLSMVSSYKFNSILYRDITKKESLLNSVLYIIKIDFSLIQKTSKEKSDNCLSFIELVKAYNIPISNYFKSIFRRVHEGENPEKELFELKTPSNDFDNYVKSLLINNFNYNDYDSGNENTLETQFKIYLRQVQSKISILFFIGLFFPIGICFLILFQLINIIFLILFIPFFLIFLNLLFKKFIKNQGYLIGLINDFSSQERKKYEEFLLFLRGFASFLRTNISPEMALLKSYNQNKKLITILKKPLKIQISYLLNFSYSFSEILEVLKSELKSLRYVIIIDAIKKYTERSAYYTSDKILEILTIIHKHQKLERKLEVIMKGEKFKILFFIFLLPIITGSISGLFPFFNNIVRSINLVGSEFLLFFEGPINIFSIVIILIVLLSSISITSNYFLKIIYFVRKLPVILVSNIIFILTFLISFFNISNIL
ncbi:MAG: hypothetical protein KGD65_01760 [Candidatus Lokiarchaeota archaeon]|nr:hypothetical protein [Candidatus Lokiarchaeota archaeon]